MEKWARYSKLWIVLMAAMFSLTACGIAFNKEEQKRGIDGYVYVAEEIPGAGQWGGVFGLNIKNSDSWLYYQMDESLYRIPIGEDGMPEKNGKEMPGGKKVFGKVFDYAVDASGGVYCYNPVKKLGSGDLELNGGTLDRYREDGSLEYSLSLEGRSAMYGSNPSDLLAAGGGGKVFLAIGDTVLAVDAAGEIASEIDVSALRPADIDAWGKLLEGADGKVYYLAGGDPRCLYELVEEGTSYAPRRCSLEGLERNGRGIGSDFYGSRWGLLYNSASGTLYHYDAGADAWKELLFWNDSDVSRDVSDVLWLSEGRLIAAYRKLSGRSVNYEANCEAYLLDKRSVEELPEREELILAAWEQCPEELEDAVILFNRASDRYHITVRVYADETRMDVSMVSSNPPDMVALLPVNAVRYGEKDVLEDLSPYLEGSSRLKREDLLDSPLEKYTIKGRLVGIPSGFICRTISANGMGEGSAAGWRMEDVMRLAERNPGRKLNGSHISWILETLCGDTIMDSFLDRESGTCSLDTEEFRSLLRWLEAYCGNLTELPYTIAEIEDPLLEFQFMRNMGDYLEYVSHPLEGWVSMGYPSPDGSPKYYGTSVGAVGIVSKSQNKEGAWMFIEEFLSNLDVDYYNSAGTMPIRKDIMDEILRDAMTPDYIYGETGEIQRNLNGIPSMYPKWYSSRRQGEYWDYATQEEVDGLMELISQADFSPVDTLKMTVMGIISEELGSYLDRSKPLEEVTRIIQNRVTIAVQERM